MSHLIKIKPNTSISDINELWRPSAGQKVVFEISKSSSFGLFVEGVALGFLKELKKREHEIEIRFNRLSKQVSVSDLVYLKSLNTPTLKHLVDANIPEILCGIFGMQLLFQASRMDRVLRHEDNDNSDFDARIFIGSCVWFVIQRNGGLLGDGKRQYLFSRHDYMVPRVLRESDHLTFPKAETFRKKITSIIQALGSENVEQEEKKDLVGAWLYHIAENAHEHGAVDISNGDAVLEEYRGILLEKLYFPNLESIQKRKDISDNIRNYLLDLWNNHGLSGISTTITIATVMDGGVGIQNSIPDIAGKAKSIDKLEQAFSRGVTRRSQKKIKAGYGLDDAVRLTRNLKACIVLSTADLFVVKTYNDIDDQGLGSLNEYDVLNKSVGTAFSLMWPSLLKDSDGGIVL
jgi:hypothetical protein